MEPDMTVTYEQTWHAMEELVDEKLTKNIGACNIGCDKIMDVLKYARIKPAILQVEMHPFLTQPNLLRFV
jgi:D-xylose reductase